MAWHGMRWALAGWDVVMLWELESVVCSGCLEKTGADDLDLGPYLEVPAVDIPSIHADNPKKMNAHSPPLESASCRTCQIHTVPPVPTRSQASNVHHRGHLQVCTHAGYSSSSLGPRWYPSFINLQCRRPSVHSSLSPQAKPTPAPVPSRQPRTPHFIPLNPSGTSQPHLTGDVSSHRTTTTLHHPSSPVQSTTPHHPAPTHLSPAVQNTTSLLPTANPPHNRPRPLQCPPLPLPPSPSPKPSGPSTSPST